MNVELSLVRELLSIGILAISALVAARPHSLPEPEIPAAVHVLTNIPAWRKC
jgi:hypothetical protein